MALSVLVVVLSFNVKEETIACIRSIRNQSYGKVHILVVDNASTDGAPEALKTQFPELDIIELPENFGWAGGNNVGIRRALERGFDLICLVNNDVIMTKGAIAELVTAAEALGPCLLHPAIYATDPPHAPQLDPGAKTIAEARPTGAPDVYELNFAYGACLMLHSDLVRRVGLIDERFFLQLEETDLYERARKVGFRSFCATRAKVFHRESSSFGGKISAAKTYYIVRNSLLLAEKHFFGTRRYARALKRLSWTLSTISAAEGHRTGSLLATLRWLASRDPNAVAGRMGLRDYLLRRFGRMRGASARRVAERLRLRS